MTKRDYGQFCGLVRALELVGERWALLIVRDLLVEPKRFTDLRQGLPRIPTNILAARLKELERAGIVRRRALPPPDRAVVYELTEYGAALDDAVVSLGRWGARSLGEPRAGDSLTADSMVMALRSTFRPEAARGRDASYELRVGPVVLHARIERGRLTVAKGALPGADLVIESGPAIRALMAGELTPDAALESGAARIAGDRALFDRFAELFRIDPAPTAPGD